MIAWFKKEKEKNEWPQVQFEEIKKRSRILVIDDNDFVYQKLFNSEGYTIEKWDDVKDLSKIEQGYYDVLLLDIQGIAKEYSKEQGFGILKHLHEGYPAQIVIAYSNADYSLKYQDFFKMADAALAKTDDYVQFKRKVDSLLQKRFSLDFYLDRIQRIAGSHINDLSKLRSLSEDAILNKNEKNLKSFLIQHIDNQDLINISLQIVQIAIGIASLCK